MLKFNHVVFQIVHVTKFGGTQMISSGQQCSNLPSLHHRIGFIQRPSFKVKVIRTLYKNIIYNIQGYRYRYVMRKPPIISNQNSVSMHGCNVAKRCLPSVSQIQISLTLFIVYTLQHARFQTTPRISPLYSFLHGFQTSGSLIQIFEFNFTLIMTSHSLLHPHIGLLFIIVPLTFSRPCMHTHYQSALSIAHMQSFSSGRSPMHAQTNLPVSIISGILYLSRACATIDVPLCVCVYSQVFQIFSHKPINLYIQ